MRPRVLPLLLLLLSAASLAQLPGDGVPPPPPGGVELWPGLAHTTFVGRKYANLTTSTAGGIETARITTFGVAPNPWLVTLRASALAPVAKGDVVLVRFSVRAASGRRGSSLVTVVFQDDTPGDAYAKSVFDTINATADWQTYSLPGTVAKPSAANATCLMFEFGFDNQQSVEVRGVSVLNYRQTRNQSSLPYCCAPTYPGRAPEAPWRAAALARIDAIRRTNLTLTLEPSLISSTLSAFNPAATKHTDSTTNTTTACAVKATMRRSAFSFGSAVNTGVWNRADDPRTPRYRAEFLRLFNTAVFEGDMKWTAWAEPTVRAEALNLTRTLLAAGLNVRGHNLVWPTCGGSGKVPASVCEPLLHNPRALEAAIEAHIRDEVGTLKGVGCCQEFDVINEPFDNNGIAAALQMGNLSLARWINASAATNPKAGRRINDDRLCTGVPLVAGVRQQWYRELFPWLLAQGTQLTGIGCESHLSSLIAGPEAALAWFDWAHGLGLSVRITEFDISPRNETLYADILRDLLIAAYSHPAADGFLMWGFWDACHWKKNAPLFRPDWSGKPGLAVWESLVLGAWRSNATGTTDAAGRWEAPPLHHGLYDLRVTCPNGPPRDYAATLNGTHQSLTLRYP